MQRNGFRFYKQRINIVVLNTPFFYLVLRQKRTESGIFTIYKLDRFIKIKKKILGILFNNAKALYRQALFLVLINYYNYFNIFSKAESDLLLTIKNISNYYIYLQNSAQSEFLGFILLYKITLKEIKEAWRYILKNFKKGFIKPSLAAWAAFILFAKKFNRKLRFYINY